VRKLLTREMPLTLLFAQVSDVASLRDIEAVRQTQDTRRHHSRLPVLHRSTLADAIAIRRAAVFSGVLSALIPQVTRSLRREMSKCVRLIDSASMRLSGPSGARAATKRSRAVASHALSWYRSPAEWRPAMTIKLQRAAVC
jgi:hypothetical protein